MKKPVYPKNPGPVKNSLGGQRGGPFRALSPKATQRLGAALAARLLPGDVVLLEGPIGAGKTTFVQGLARALGVRHAVTSPTFVLRKQYALRRPVRGLRSLNHLDAYRLSSVHELREVLDAVAEEDLATAWCIEWGAPYAGTLGGKRVWQVRFRVVDDTQRQLTIRSPKNALRRQ